MELIKEICFWYVIIAFTIGGFGLIFTFVQIQKEKRKPKEPIPEPYDLNINII